MSTDAHVNTSVVVLVGLGEISHVIHSNPGYAPEAASPTTDKQKIYYHQKDGSGIFHIYLRYRTTPVGINSIVKVDQGIQVYPNPANGILNIVVPFAVKDFSVSVYAADGCEVLKASNKRQIDVSTLRDGIYFLIVRENNSTRTCRFLKN